MASMINPVKHQYSALNVSSRFSSPSSPVATGASTSTSALSAMTALAVERSVTPIAVVAQPLSSVPAALEVQSLSSASFLSLRVNGVASSTDTDHASPKVEQVDQAGTNLNSSVVELSHSRTKTCDEVEPDQRTLSEACPSPLSDPAHNNKLGVSVPQIGEILGGDGCRPPLTPTPQIATMSDNITQGSSCTVRFPSVLARPDGDYYVDLPGDLSLSYDSGRRLHLNDVVVLIVNPTGTALHSECHFSNESQRQRATISFKGRNWSELVMKPDHDKWQTYCTLVSQGLYGSSEVRHPGPSGLFSPVYRVHLGEDELYVQTFSILVPTATHDGRSSGWTCVKLHSNQSTPVIVQYHSLTKEFPHRVWLQSRSVDTPSSGPNLDYLVHTQPRSNSVNEPGTDANLASPSCLAISQSTHSSGPHQVVFDLTKSAAQSLSNSHPILQPSECCSSTADIRCDTDQPSTTTVFPKLGQNIDPTTLRLPHPVNTIGQSAPYFANQVPSTAISSHLPPALTAKPMVQLRPELDIVSGQSSVKINVTRERGDRVVRLQNLLPPQAIQQIRRIWKEIYFPSASTSKTVTTSKDPQDASGSNKAHLRELFARRVRQVVRQYLGPNALVTTQLPSSGHIASSVSGMNEHCSSIDTAGSLPPAISSSLALSLSRPTVPSTDVPASVSSTITSSDRLFGTELRTSDTLHSHSATQAQCVTEVPPLATNVSTVAMGCTTMVSTFSVTAAYSPPPLSLGFPRMPYRRQTTSGSQCCMLEWLLSEDSDLGLLPASFYDSTPSSRDIKPIEAITSSTKRSTSTTVSNSNCTVTYTLDAVRPTTQSISSPTVFAFSPSKTSPLTGTSTLSSPSAIHMTPFSAPPRTPVDASGAPAPVQSPTDFSPPIVTMSKTNSLLVRLLHTSTTTAIGGPHRSGSASVSGSEPSSPRLLPTDIHTRRTSEGALSHPLVVDAPDSSRSSASLNSPTQESGGLSRNKRRRSGPPTPQLHQTIPHAPRQRHVSSQLLTASVSGRPQRHSPVTSLTQLLLQDFPSTNLSGSSDIDSSAATPNDGQLDVSKTLNERITAPAHNVLVSSDQRTVDSTTVHITMLPPILPEQNFSPVAGRSSLCRLLLDPHLGPQMPVKRKNAISTSTQPPIPPNSCRGRDVYDFSTEVNEDSKPSLRSKSADCLPSDTTVSVPSYSSEARGIPSPKLDLPRSLSPKAIAEEVEFLYEIIQRDELMGIGKDSSSDCSPLPKRSRLDSQTSETDVSSDKPSTADEQAVARICEHLQEGFGSGSPSTFPLKQSPDSTKTLPRSEGTFASPTSMSPPRTVWGSQLSICRTSVGGGTSMPTCNSGFQSPTPQRASRPLNAAAIAAARASQQAAALQLRKTTNPTLVEQRNRLIQHQLLNQVTVYSPNSVSSASADSGVTQASVIVAPPPSLLVPRTHQRSSKPIRTASGRHRRRSTNPVEAPSTAEVNLDATPPTSVQLIATTVIPLTPASSFNSTLANSDYYVRNPEYLPRYLRSVGPNVQVQLSSHNSTVQSSTDNVYALPRVPVHPHQPPAYHTSQHGPVMVTSGSVSITSGLSSQTGTPFPAQDHITFAHNRTTECLMNGPSQISASVSNSISSSSHHEAHLQAIPLSTSPMMRSHMINTQHPPSSFWSLTSSQPVQTVISYPATPCGHSTLSDPRIPLTVQLPEHSECDSAVYFTLSSTMQPFSTPTSTSFMSPQHPFDQVSPSLGRGGRQLPVSKESEPPHQQEDCLLPEDIINDVFDLETMVAAKRKFEMQPQRQQGLKPSTKQQLNAYRNSEPSHTRCYSGYLDTTDPGELMAGPATIALTSSSSPSPCSPSLGPNQPIDPHESGLNQ